jgi:hypothetical protein
MKLGFNEMLKFLLVFFPSVVLLWKILPHLPPSSFWLILLGAAFLWFMVELRFNWTDKERIKRALIIGILLVVFNLVINYSGLIRGLYVISSRHSLFYILANPAELLLLSLFGGTAWFLHLPKKFNLLYSVSDVVMLSSFGTITELLILTKSGLMRYMKVAFPDPFLTYAIVWSIAHLIFYKVLK